MNQQEKKQRNKINYQVVETVNKNSICFKKYFLIQSFFKNLQNDVQ